MRTAIVLLMTVLSQEAEASWRIVATCNDGKFRSVDAWATYEACVDNVDALERGPDGSRCSFACATGSEVEYLAVLGSSVAQGVAEVFGGPAIRHYDTRREGYPWGRPIIWADPISIGVGLNMAGEENKTRFAIGPAAIHLRLLPRVSVGAFGTLLVPAASNIDTDDHDVETFGTSLRLALKSNHMRSFKERNDHAGYYELYLDAGYGWAEAGYGGGSGNLYTAALGLHVQTGWIFAFGLSTRFTSGRVTDAVDGETGQRFDLDVQSWDILLAHLLILGY